MNHCTQCGHRLGLGRFCTNCGHPVAESRPDPLTAPLDAPLFEAPVEPPVEPLVEPDGTSEPADDAPVAGPAEGRDWRTDTAERSPRPPSAVGPAPGTAAPRPTAPPRVPPVVVEPPPPPRFPLFADEVPDGLASGSTPALVPIAADVAVADQPASAQDALADVDEWYDEEEWEDWEEDSGRRRWVWVVVGLVLLVLVVAGAWFLGNALGGDGDTTATDDPSTSTAAESGSGAAEVVDHTAEATATAPRTAPPNEDVDGNPTSYDASNMLDGVPETTWRAAGDGTGLKIVFTFEEKTSISSVGLINGYDKSAQDGGQALDWYAGHRRITEVTWNLGGTPPVRQSLEDGVRTVQTTEFDPVEVKKVVLRIVAVTAPGDGPAARNFTAISDVFLGGS